MTTAVQVQYRRGSSSAVSSFTGASGELIVDTTNNRVVVQDGATAGGFPAARLSEVVTNARTQVSDGNYTALATDRTVAYITLTGARIVSLPAASTYPTGSRLLVVDESGACSATNTITLSRAGSDLIDGATGISVASAYGYVAIESNGLNKWTIIDQTGTLNGLSGPLSIACSGGGTLTAAGSTITIGEPGGSRNGFYNPAMDVWQRGTSGTATTSAGPSTQMSADGWYVVPTGASVAWTQAAGRLITKNSLQVTGASSVTDVVIKQRIESFVAARYCSQTVTVQAQVYNNTGGAVTPTLTVKHAGAVDSWGSPTTDVNAASLQVCPNGAWTNVAYTFAASASSYYGVEISLDFGNNFGSSAKSVQLTELDVRVTPGVVTGVNSTPPPVELPPLAFELPFCMRYYYRRSSQSSLDYLGNLQAFSTGAAFGKILDLPTPMRAAPTMSCSSASHLSAWTATGGGPNAFTGATFVASAYAIVAGDWSGSSGLSAGNAVAVIFNTTSGWIDASAEL